MIRFFIYLLLFATVLYVLSKWGRRDQELKSGAPAAPPKPRNLLKAKANPREVWLQVYETATIEEARLFQARIQEQDIECIVYEQGKKDIHGNALKGIGIAVPKTAAGVAQGIISRSPD